MEQRIEPRAIATILLESPVWARIGLTLRDDRMRERAAETIGAIVSARLAGDAVEVDRNQLTLAL